MNKGDVVRQPPTPLFPPTNIDREFDCVHFHNLTSRGAITVDLIPWDIGNFKSLFPHIHPLHLPPPFTPTPPPSPSLTSPSPPSLSSGYKCDMALHATGQPYGRSVMVVSNSYIEQLSEITSGVRT